MLARQAGEEIRAEIECDGYKGQRDGEDGGTEPDD